MNRFRVLEYHAFAVNKLKEYPFITYYILLNFLAFIVSNVVFVYQNKLQFDIALRACVFVFGACQATGMFYSYGINLTEIQAVHSKLDEIIIKTVEGKFCTQDSMQHFTTLFLYRGRSKHSQIILEMGDKMPQIHEIFIFIWMLSNGTGHVRFVSPDFRHLHEKCRYVVMEFVIRSVFPI